MSIHDTASMPKSFESINTNVRARTPHTETEEIVLDMRVQCTNLMQIHIFIKYIADIICSELLLC